MADDLDGTFIVEKDEGHLPSPKGNSIWGRLVSLADPFKNVDLIENDVWFGRHKELPANTRFEDKRMSMKHVHIFLENEQIFIEDNSSNGTFVNGNRLTKGSKQAFKNGDEITFFAPKPDPKTPHFVFQDKRKKVGKPNNGSDILNTSDEKMKPLVKSDLISNQKLDSTMISTSHQTVTSSQKLDLPSKNDNQVLIVNNNHTNSDIIKSTILPVSNEDKGKRKREDSNDINDANPPKKPVLDNASTGDDDDTEESLTCGICQDIFYKCVSLMPCLHSFCCSCISDWIDRSDNCPECRVKIKGVSKPHILQNLVDKFLIKHPQKKRSEEEIKNLGDRADIEALIKKLKNKRGQQHHDDDDDDDGSDSDDDQPIIHAPLNFNPLGLGVGFGGGIFGLGGLVRRCQQCLPGDGGAIGGPAAGFVCPPNGFHLICTACARNVPDRTGEPGIIQRCDICHRVFCHLYWGCTAPNAANTIKQISDFDFQTVPGGPNGAFGGNLFEKQILDEYLQLKGISATDCYKACLAKLDASESKYSRTSMTPNINSQNHGCLNCANSLFSDLVFDYTKAIPKQDLPPSGQNRPDCYYGRNCRTQTHNVNHRNKYNHVCDQTKF